MREFFHGWRRKVGCVALVMACAMMGMWMRSLVIADDITVRRTKSRENLQSADGSIRWMSLNNVDPEKPSFEWRTEPVEFANWILKRLYVRWRFRRMGLGFGPIVTRGRGFCLVVAYWLVTIPLTLLSAYLLLWKPRKRTEPDNA